MGVSSFKCHLPNIYEVRTKGRLRAAYHAVMKPDTTQVTIPPPVIYFGCLFAGVAVDYIWPFPLLPKAMQYPLGVTVIGLSVLLFGWALIAFSRSNTSINHAKATTELISSGPFRFSRNPVYVSMSLLVIGIGITIDSIWVVGMVLPAITLTYYLIILKEEIYLERKFGDEYRSYKSKVRRWI